ncbi:hypothetical protein [Halorhabdus amylolytica]|nr:hypothetical protein [Halorhabdus amylolytica]
MGTKHRDQERTTVSEHLSTALETAEDENTKYHLREAYQKLIFLTDSGRD